MGNPIVEIGFSVDVICRGKFRCLYRVALFETRELFPSSGSILPPNTNFPTFCRAFVLSLPSGVNELLFCPGHCFVVFLMVNYGITSDYLQIAMIMDAARYKKVEKMNLVGIKFLNWRSNKQGEDESRRSITCLSKHMEKDWRQLQSLAKKQSIRNIETKIENISRKKLRTAANTVSLSPK